MECMVLLVFFIEGKGKMENRLTNFTEKIYHQHLLSKMVKMEGRFHINSIWGDLILY